jgi:uncharacterized protein (DUF433 family)
MTATLATQIEIDPRGVAWVAGTAVKVREIVMDKTAHGWSPEEIHFQHPALSMAQIHGALTYYYENQSTLDAEMEADMRQAKELAEAVSDDDLRRRLLAGLAEASNLGDWENRICHLPL